MYLIITILKKLKINVNFILPYNEFLNEDLNYTVGIKQRNVPKTIQNIKENILSLLRLDETNISFIGSAGFKPDRDSISHNINLAIDVNKLLKSNNNLQKEYTLAFIQDQIKRIGYNTKLLKETKEIITNWPVNGNKRNGFVELRIKLTENMSWVKWVRENLPYNEKSNKYPSKYRELLFESISNHIKYDVLEYFDNKENVKYFNKYIFESDEGLNIQTYSFSGRNGVLKHPTELWDSKKRVTSNPKEFSKILFGENVNTDELKTFEKVYEYLMSSEFPYRKKRKRILETYKKLLSSKNLELPVELNKK